MTERDQLISRNFAAAYTWFQRQDPGGTVERTGRMICARMPGGLTDFNVALPDPAAPHPTDPSSPVFAEQLSQVLSFFKTSFSCWAIQGSEPPPDPQELGFASRMDYTGLYLDLRTLNPLGPLADEAPDSEDALRVYRVSQMQDLEVFANLVALGWDLPAQPYRDFFTAFPQLLNPACPKAFYIGYVGDKPACCMELFTESDGRVVGLYYVTTRASFRRQGLARALQSRVLLEARRKGAVHAVVIAEPDECRLLQRLGFIPCATWHEYLHSG